MFPAVLRKMRKGILPALCIICALPLCAEAGLQADEQATIEVFERVSPSVVFIKNAALQWDWFSTYIYEIPQGAGSGFIWDAEGHIVTNFHVIYQADKIEVILSDRNSYQAEVVGGSPDHDLAVLKINAPVELLQSIPVGSSGGLRVGQKVLSIGNPFGLDYSLTTGVVSALGRSMRSIGGRKIHDVIQTDAAINVGNSGGPLLDSSGNLIGVATSIYSPSGASAGVGFAIPVDTVKRVVPQLITCGKVRRAGLGISLVPDYIRQRLGIEGALIMEVSRGGAADEAGLRGMRRNLFGEVLYGDIIISVDGKPIESSDRLSEFFDHKKVGDEVAIRFRRQDTEYDVTAVLQEL